MADFLSCNVLGTWYGPNDMLKQEMPTEVLGETSPGVPGTIATPVSDGGVMCLQTSDLTLAARRNWKHSGVGSTILGAVIDVAIDIRAPLAALYTATHTTFTFEFGQTGIEELGAGTGVDFTGGDPHRDLVSFEHESIAIGTSLQRDAVGNSIQSVYLTLTLQIEYHGYRWWDSLPGDDTVTGGFSMKLTGVISPEDGFDWEEATELAETTTTWFSNWKVYAVGALDDWGLNSTPLGGPAEVALFNTLVGSAQCYFKFGNEDPDSPVPLRGYDNITEDFPVSEVRITSCEIRIPTVLGSMTPL